MRDSKHCIATRINLLFFDKLDKRIFPLVYIHSTSVFLVMENCNAGKLYFVAKMWRKCDNKRFSQV